MAAGQVSLMSTIFFLLEFCICYSLNELPTHLCTEVVVPLLHHFQPIWIKACWDIFSLCAISILVAFLLLNTFQTKQIPKAFFFFYVCQLSVFSHTLFERCPARKLHRFMNICRAICRHEVLEIHKIPLYIVSLF